MQRLLQFTLDLFDPQPAPAITPAAPRPPPFTGPTQPEPTLQQVLAPATFRHPRANREALLANTHVAYEFRRGKRRTIGFVVGPDGLVVSAPKWVPLYEIDAAVR